MTDAASATACSLLLAGAGARGAFYSSTTTTSSSTSAVNSLLSADVRARSSGGRLLVVGSLLRSLPLFFLLLPLLLQVGRWAHQFGDSHSLLLLLLLWLRGQESLSVLSSLFSPPLSRLIPESVCGVRRCACACSGSCRRAP